jgi:hypothetical protein
VAVDAHPLDALELGEGLLEFLGVSPKAPGSDIAQLDMQAAPVGLTHAPIMVAE